MKILIKISHPAHVHFFKYFIKEMTSKGHEIKILTTPKEISIELLEHFDIPYHTFSPSENSSKVKSQLKLHYETWKLAVEFEPDILTAIGGTSISHVSRFVEGISIVFSDTEHATLQNKITYPFANQIYTPDCYLDDLGAKQIRYPGYHELAYLHPNRFEPDPSVLELIDANKDDKIVILRLISWEAAHDVGQSGFGDVVDIVAQIESTGAKVVITSEDNIPKEIGHCQYDLPPHKIHDLMYYSSLYIGEGGTMASESAVLGTPAIFISTLRLGYLNELENKYGLLYNFSKEYRQRNALKKSLSILENYDEKKWQKKRKIMLEDKIDVTQFMMKFFEDFYST